MTKRERKLRKHLEPIGSQAIDGPKRQMTIDLAGDKAYPLLRRATRILWAPFVQPFLNVKNEVPDLTKAQMKRYRKMEQRYVDELAGLLEELFDDDSGMRTSVKIKVYTK